jgi:hypothetical protein
VTFDSEAASDTGRVIDPVSRALASVGVQRGRNVRANGAIVLLVGKLGAGNSGFFCCKTTPPLRREREHLNTTPFRLSSCHLPALLCFCFWTALLCYCSY